ncbi:MAG TPA: GatB/YqeY domain-containing protein [Dehalococcoidia bacterium]|nr:GatB/YqeY domain-containing protein [Dehalococcoidia bacterium]
MALLQSLKDDLKQAMKEGDKVRVSALRMLLANINNAAIAQGTPVDDGGILSIVAKQARQHRESIEAFSKGNRHDLVAKEESELAVLLQYLPKQISREEIIVAARQVIEEVGARGSGDKGKVMSKLMAQLKGKAEGHEVNTVVSELLASL